MGLVEETAQKWQNHVATMRLDEQRKTYQRMVGWLGADLASALGLHYTDAAVHATYRGHTYRIGLSVNGVLGAEEYTRGGYELVAVGQTPGEFCSRLIEAIEELD